VTTRVTPRPRTQHHSIAALHHLFCPRVRRGSEAFGSTAQRHVRINPDRVRAESRAASVAEIKAAIDGAYILEEWHTDAGVFRPPQVEGRVVFLNGAVVTILID
jgi:hypothetical protein